MSGVRRVGCDPTCTPLGPRDVQVLDGWKPAASHLLCGAHDALQPQSVSGGGSSVPHGDGGGEDGLDDGRVELHQHLGGQLELLQLPQEEHPLLGLLNEGADGRLPLKVPGDGGAQEAEAVHSGDSIQFNSIQFNSIQFNSILFI